MIINKLSIGGGKIGLSCFVQKPPRESNLELLRIFAMLAIIAHHSVVNSGVVQLMDLQHPQANDYFLALWGAWGKTAINSFILISGYFLCKGRLTWKRWLKLYFQIQFYSWLILAIFAITGYENITMRDIVRRLFFPFPGANNGFSSSFMIFYAGVPLYNKMLDGLSKRHFKLALAVLLGMFTISSSFFSGVTMNEPLWYVTLYFVAAYIRLYPSKLSENLYSSIVFLSFSIIAAVGVIAYKLYRGHTIDLPDMYFYISDSNKLLAFSIGLFAFLVAKNAPKFHNRFINTFASGSFGVLLIHTSSATMRKWLWQDVVNAKGMYYNSTSALMIMSVTVPIIIYIVCAFLDLLRQQFVEKPVMSKFNALKIRWEN